MRIASFVVTGASGGIGRAIAERLARAGQVVIIDLAEPTWTGRSMEFVPGDARDPDVTLRAAAAAEGRGDLIGWVNNAAIFRDADLVGFPPTGIVELIAANLALAVTGCHTAVNHYLMHQRAGAIVNVSSHQARRAVRGALPYATAKAAIEGLTRAVAVDHGPDGIRANAVALGSISTARYESYRREHPEVEQQMAELHPLGRVGTGAEVATAVEFLLSPAASFVNGVVLPVDGGRAAGGADPEAR